MGASNPVDEAADGYEMALPTTNRIFWISWNPTKDEWCRGMRTAWGADIPEDELRWKQRIATFIDDNPTWLHRAPVDSPTTEAYGLNMNNASDMEVFRSAWASRRSWDNLSRVLSKAPEDVFVQDSIAQGIVGFAATTAFREWLRKNDNISPADVMKDPSSVDWKNLSVNDATLVFRSLLEMINEDTALAVINVFSVCADQGRANLAVPYVKEVLTKVMGPEMSAQAKVKHRQACAAIIPKYESVASKA